MKSRGFWPSLSLLINHSGCISCPAGGGCQEGFREERCVQPCGMGRGVPGGQMPKVKVQKSETSHITGASVAHLVGAGGNTGCGSRVGMGRCKGPGMPQGAGLYPAGDWELPGILSGRRSGQPGIYVLMEKRGQRTCKEGQS